MANKQQHNAFPGQVIVQDRSFALMRRAQSAFHALGPNGHLVRSSIWSLVGSATARGATVLSVIICARALDTTKFGQFSIIQSTIFLLTGYAALGLGLTGTKFIAENRSTDKLKASRILQLSVWLCGTSGAVVSLLAAILARPIARHLLGDEALARDIALASPALFFGALNAAQTGALAGFERFRSLARVNLISGVLTLTIFASFVVGAGERGAMIAIALSAAATCVVAGIAVRQARTANQMPAVGLSFVKEWRILFDFGFPTLLTAALAGSALWACNLFILRSRGGYYDLGLFSAADKWRQLATFPGTCLIAAALPHLSNAHGTGDNIRFRRVSRQLIAGGVLSAALPAAALIMFPGLAMSVYGRHFEAGKQLLIVLALASVPTILNSVLGVPLIASGRMWTRAGFDLVLAAVMILLTSLLVPQLGAIGAAWGQLAAYSLVAMLLFGSTFAGLRSRRTLTTTAHSVFGALEQTD